MKKQENKMSKIFGLVVNSMINLKKISFFSLLTATSMLTHGQSITEIKQDKVHYIWGEGVGNTLKEADNAALSDLIGQITTQVESRFQKTVEQTTLGSNIDFKETVNDVVKTYSSATLKTTERMVLQNEPEARVFRYIKRSEISKIFESRKNKAIELAHNGEEALENLQMADALRYFYWSQTLLRSHPDASDIQMTTTLGKPVLLITWLPEQINTIFSNLSINISDVENKETYNCYTLDIRYKNQPVRNFDYTYWSGQDWSNIISAKDGLGVVEFPKSQDKPIIRLKAEYIFENESSVDLELRDIMQKLPEVPYKKCYLTAGEASAVSATPVQSSTTNATSTSATNAEGSLTLLTHANDQEQVLKKVITAISSHNYNSVASLFTSEGLSVYQALLQYGNARILKVPTLKYYQFNDQVVCRSIPMSFDFKSNNRVFVEDVVFYFDKETKICNLSFGLDKKAVDDIAAKGNWSEQVRMQLINFMENYKTAYALKRLDYLEKVFSDDALIITGRVTKVVPSPEFRYMNNEIVKYNRQTKAQYLRNLKYSFNSNEFINLRLTDNNVKQSGKTPNVYGIQIKQDYFSANYGDTGYLFLLIDFTNQKEPQVHVRTWQPERNPDGSIYGIADF
jgi:hypothetical protein